MANNTPNIVVEAVADAVNSAIQFGVSADDFKRLVAMLWDDELFQKRKHDAATFEEK